MKFKKGDKVRILKHEAYPNTGANCYSAHTCIGEKGYVWQIHSDSRFEIWGINNQKYWGHFDESELENFEGKEEKVEEKYGTWFVSGDSQIYYYWDSSKFVIKQEPNWMTYLNSRISPTPKKRMKLSAIARRMLDANTRTLVKAGYLDNELELTTEGEETLLAILTTANMEALVKEAKKEIRERKDEEEDE